MKQTESWLRFLQRQGWRLVFLRSGAETSTYILTRLLHLDQLQSAKFQMARNHREQEIGTCINALAK